MDINEAMKKTSRAFTLWTRPHNEDVKLARIASVPYDPQESSRLERVTDNRVRFAALLRRKNRLIARIIAA